MTRREGRNDKGGRGEMTGEVDIIVCCLKISPDGRNDKRGWLKWQEEEG